MQSTPTPSSPAQLVQLLQQRAEAAALADVQRSRLCTPPHCSGWAQVAEQCWKSYSIRLACQPCITGCHGMCEVCAGAARPPLPRQSCRPLPPTTATHNRRCTHPRRRAHSARLGTLQPGRRRKPSCSCCSTSSALMPGGGGEGGGRCESGDANVCLPLASMCTARAQLDWKFTLLARCHTQVVKHLRTQEVQYNKKCSATLCTQRRAASVPSPAANAIPRAHPGRGAARSAPSAGRHRHRG